ncbi:hypothetical protein EJQ19_02610 [Paenibacillus whitsoniae]|uniref:Hint domain-containing protein n=2 Tax=Paenibacillus whitsoniae TaxID=2496558 RepID=A0A430JK20_9BACL|nr:hypothetical protein EJQ19_02610 [Paenibacillus whitsoniae]
MAIAGKTYYFKVYKTVGTYSATSAYDLILGNLFPDNNEPNNTAADAKSITPGGSSISSYISYLTDGDVWKFTTGSGNIGNVSVSLVTPNDADFELQVFEGSTDGDGIKTSYNTGTGLAESLTLLVNPSTTYYVKVFSKGNLTRSASPYTLTVGGMPVDTAELNNSDNEASTISPGSYVDSYISYDSDRDIWKFTAGESNAGWVSANLTVPSGVDYELQVYEGATEGKDPLDQSTLGGNQTEKVDFKVIPGKTYYLKVYSANNAYHSSIPYRLTLNALPVVTDNNEPNNGFDKAAVITPGTAINSYLSSLSDFDVWKFTAGATNNGFVTATMNVPVDVDYELQVYEDSNLTTELGGSYKKDSQDPESVPFIVKPGKTYYLKVYRYSTSSISPDPYTLQLSGMPIDNYEDNGNSGNAKDILPNTPINSYISHDNDGDVWKFETAASNIGSMQARLTNIPAGVNYELQVYEGSTDNDQIADSQNLGNADELITFNVKPDTKYFVKVYSQGNQYHSSSPYTVSIGNLPVAPDSYESNNTAAQATLLTPGTPISSYISSKTDADYFYFMTDATTVGYMNIGLTDPEPFADFGDDFKPDYDFQVFKGSESDANLVGYSTSKERSSTIEVKVVPNTKYYIKIYNGGTGFAPEPYQLNVAALPHDEEGNDNESTAKNLPPRGVVESYLYKASDVDYWMYRSGASESGTKVFGMKVPSGSDYELQVYPAGGYDTDLMKGSYNNNNDYEYILMDVSPNTTYYMKVYGALGKGLPAQYSEDLPYTLSVGTDQYGEGTTGGNDNAVDSYEVNNTRDQATLVEDGRTVNSYLFYDGDVDYYKVRSRLLAGNMTVSLAVPAGQDYELQVFEGSSSRYWTSDSSGNSAESISFPVQPNTNYYVKVYGALVGSGHSYSGNLLDKYVLTFGQAPNTTVDQWITDSESTKLTSHSKWDESKFSEASDWIDTEWQAVDGVAGQLNDLHEYWENQKDYLQGLINTGSEGLKEWAQNRYDLESERVFLIELSLTGTEGQQAWANNQLFIVNLALDGTYGQQQWAQDLIHWQNLYDYYQDLVNQNPSNSWAEERRDVTAILKDPNATNKEWALDRWNWLVEEDYLQHLINENLDLDTVRWAQGRADLVDKILRGTPEEQNWARKRWGLLELIEHGTPAERDKAQYDLEEMDGKHVVLYTPMVGVSSTIVSGCDSSSCMTMLNEVAVQIYKDKLNESLISLNAVKCAAWNPDRPAALCDEWTQWMESQYSSYAAKTVSSSVDQIIQSSSGNSFIDAVWDVTKLTGYFTKGLVLGIVSPLTDLYDMLKNYNEIVKLAQLIVGTLVDFAKDPSPDKLSSIAQVLGSTVVAQIIQLWDESTGSKYSVAETIGSIVGQAVIAYFTVGFSAEAKLYTKIGSLSTELKAAKKIETLIPCNCFTAGTKVLTQDGERSIEQVQLGDFVLAKNPDTGEMAYKEVDLLFQKEITESWNITVGDELITTTDEHPFWIHNKGWVVAKDLVVGDLFETSDGSYLAIDKIEIKEQHTMVYNFRVKDFHTYYVSNLKILTHNSDCAWVSKSALGDFIGSGGNKKVYAYGEGKVVGVLKDGVDPSVLTEEITILAQIKNAGLPTVNAELVKLDGGALAIMYDRFEQGSKDVVRLVNGEMKTVGESPLLNQRSINDLKSIRNTMFNKGARINDLQFLIGNDGRIVIADPLGITFKSYPSSNNLQMIDLLIKAAEKNL